MNVPFHKPYITDSEIKNVVNSLKTGWLTTGTKCYEFERMFSIFCNSDYAVAVNSGTAALHLALEAIGIKEGDVIITTPMTFAATAEVIRYFQAKPLFVDIEPATFNIDVNKIKTTIEKSGALREHIKAIIPVHFAGHPCDMDEILFIANKHKLKVIEDSAHALPARYKGQIVGNIGDITCFSFYATKNITTGEGGMAVTNNSDWAERMRVMSLHGISKDAWNRYADNGKWYYEIIAPGYKYNMSDIAAALGIAQMKKVDFFQQRREEIAHQYSEAFKDLEQINVPFAQSDVQHSWHLYIIKLNLEYLKIDRNQFIEQLKDRGIGTSVHFIPLHLHPYYRKTYGYKPKDFPVAYETYKRIISLPIYPKMTDDDVERVVGAVKEVAIKFKK